jgi:hypothetical protein
MNEEEYKAVIEYFRNKAAEFELQYIEMQLKVLQLSKKVEKLQGTLIDAAAPDDAGDTPQLDFEE